ncbi:hypothetical protein EV401DRAFT_1984179, partial [Pisolithus croceorrhizus]
AQTLATKLEAMFAGYGDQYGRIVAMPGVAEKGFINVRIEVSTPGGHSSLPPPHTVR